ncbi:MAG TPA: AbrB/MazE/SpoVT family DNA-binding domain-containing protein [Burkholderiales bacterium]|nr:AbrB/MazE/SpoVT family DNA-binding domain-containing protein [Burkholderiales bacterium]
MSYATITSKGQTTIPKEIRDQFNLRPGDKVFFFVNEAGRIEIQPFIDITAVKGLLKRPKAKAATLEQMNEAPRQAARRRFKRAA